mgnify:CR=1 FL=1
MSEIFHKRQPSPYGIVEDFIRSPEFTLSHGEREQDKKGSHTGLPLLFTSDIGTTSRVSTGVRTAHATPIVYRCHVFSFTGGYSQLSSG